MASKKYEVWRNVVAQLRSHLPIIGLLTFGVIIFAGMHGAIRVAAGLVALHLAAVIAVTGFRRLHSTGSAEVGQS